MKYNYWGWGLAAWPQYQLKSSSTLFHGMNKNGNPHMQQVSGPLSGYLPR